MIFGDSVKESIWTHPVVNRPDISSHSIAWRIHWIWKYSTGVWQSIYSRIRFLRTELPPLRGSPSRKTIYDTIAVSSHMQTHRRHDNIVLICLLCQWTSLREWYPQSTRRSMRRSKTAKDGSDIGYNAWSRVSHSPHMKHISRKVYL